VTEEYVYAEWLLADALGLRRDVLREAREECLEQGTDWDVAQRQVAYREAALPRLLEALGVDLPKKRARAPGGLTLEKLRRQALIRNREGEVRPGQEKRMLVVDEQSARSRNRHILFGRLRGDQEQGGLPDVAVSGVLRVLVRDSERFVTGMEMECLHRQEDLWEYVGRMPRRRGRW